MTDESRDERGRAGPVEATTRAAPALRLPITFVLIAINCAIYGLMAWASGQSSFSGEFVVEWGGDYAPYTLGGQVWRLLTSTFLHFSLVHLLSNMLCLFYWGLVTERALGWRRWLATYLAAGVVASTASTLFQHDVVSAGASGSIAGLLGVMLAMFFKGFPEVSGARIFQNLVLNAMIAFVVQVDWIAHLGGLLAGLAIGLLWLPARTSRGPAP
jgi:rhomboid protease GluP